jgi:hypothetical protein
MSRIRIVNPIERDFGMVPRALWDAPLPFAAKGVAAYLFCLRDGAMPYVAEIEAALGLGRDARRKAFAALEAAGVIEWVIERNERNAILAKTLVLHPLAVHAPENQSHGKTPVLASHAPEKPSGGKSTPAGVGIHPCSDGISGDSLRERKIQRAASARSAVRSAPVARVNGQARPFASSDIARLVQCLPNLTAFDRSRILSGQSLLIDGVMVKPGSPHMDALRQALRSQEAGELGGVV